MPNELIRTCLISGCGKRTNQFRRHCTTVHGMSTYIYECFRLLIQSLNTEICYSANGDYVRFFNAIDDTLLLKVRLPSDKNKSRPRKSQATTTEFPRERTTSGEISESAATTSTPNITSTTPIVPVINDSLTPSEIHYSPSSVADRLQKAGLYDLAPESLPEISGYRRLLHLAEGDSLTVETTQLYNIVRKLYAYLRSRNSSDIFSEENVSSAFETLIRCGVTGDSLAIWIKALCELVIHLHVFTRNQSLNIKRIVTNIFNKYQFAWLNILERRIEEIMFNDVEVTITELGMIIAYMAGCILRAGHPPKIITKFRAEEYEQGCNANVFIIRDVYFKDFVFKTQASFVLDNFLQRPIFAFYYRRLRPIWNRGTDRFFINTKGSVWRNPLQFIRRLIARERLPAMPLNTIEYQDIFKRVTKFS